MVTQVGAFFLLRYPSMWSFLLSVLQASMLPGIAAVVSTASFNFLASRFFFGGLPLKIVLGVSYMVQAVAQVMIMCSFLPRCSFNELDWRTDEPMQLKYVIPRWGFAAASDLVGLSFAVQRWKFAIETTLSKWISGIKEPKPLQITQVMDSTWRGSLTVGNAQFVTMTIFILVVIPGGDAPWPHEPLVWIGLAVALVSKCFVDFVIVVTHRRLFPIPGESFLGTYNRLKQPYQQSPEAEVGSVSG